MVVKSIGILSLAKILGFLYGVMGLLGGFVFSLISLLGVGPIFEGTGGEEIIFRILFGFGAIIFLPIFYGFMGFFCGALTALFYNVIALFVGGLELELE